MVLAPFKFRISISTRFFSFWNRILCILTIDTYISRSCIELSCIFIFCIICLIHLGVVMSKSFILFRNSSGISLDHTTFRTTFFCKSIMSTICRYSCCSVGVAITCHMAHIQSINKVCTPHEFIVIICFIIVVKVGIISFREVSFFKFITIAGIVIHRRFTRNPSEVCSDGYVHLTILDGHRCDWVILNMVSTTVGYCKCHSA